MTFRKRKHGLPLFLKRIKKAYRVLTLIVEANDGGIRKRAKKDTIKKQKAPFLNGAQTIFDLTLFYLFILFTVGGNFGISTPFYSYRGYSYVSDQVMFFAIVDQFLLP